MLVVCGCLNRLVEGLLLRWVLVLVVAWVIDIVLIYFCLVTCGVLML